MASIEIQNMYNGYTNAELWEAIKSHKAQFPNRPLTNVVGSNSVKIDMIRAAHEIRMTPRTKAQAALLKRQAPCCAPEKPSAMARLPAQANPLASVSNKDLTKELMNRLAGLTVTPAPAARAAHAAHAAPAPTPPALAKPPKAATKDELKDRLRKYGVGALFKNDTKLADLQALCLEYGLPIAKAQA